MADSPRWYAWMPVESELYFYRNSSYILTHSIRHDLSVGYSTNSESLMRKRKAFFIPEELML